MQNQIKDRIVIRTTLVLAAILLSTLAIVFASPPRVAKAVDTCYRLSGIWGYGAYAGNKHNLTINWCGNGTRIYSLSYSVKRYSGTGWAIFAYDQGLHWGGVGSFGAAVYAETTWEDTIWPYIYYEDFVNPRTEMIVNADGTWHSFP